MKKKLRKTGEIVDVISYSNPYCLERDKLDCVSYIDSKGVEHPSEKGLNLWWDFEDVEDVLSTDIDWEQTRIKAAIATLQGFTSNSHDRLVGESTQNLVKWSVEIANALIAELKKGGNNE